MEKINLVNHHKEYNKDRSFIKYFHLLEKNLEKKKLLNEKYIQTQNIRESSVYKALNEHQQFDLDYHIAKNALKYKLQLLEIKRIKFILNSWIRTNVPKDFFEKRK